jgi:tetratricopeptide (TPR) repeat protein
MRAGPKLASIAVLLLASVGSGLADAPTRPSDPKSTARAADPKAVDPKAADAKPEQSIQPAGRQKILEDLFGRLEKTQDATEAQGISGAIQRVWMRSGSDTADLVMERAGTLIQKKDWKTAEDMLDRLVDIEPQWAEAWNRRATVRFFQRDTTGAMEDIAHVLQLEPRHFTAMVGLGAILERNEQNAQALRVFRRVLEINPQLEEIRKKVDKLSIEVEGREI